MKKFLTTILAVVAGFACMTASAATFTIDVDHAENIEASYKKAMWGGLYYQTSYYELKDGLNTIESGEETSFKVSTPTGSLAIIDEITKDGVTITDYDNISIEDGMAIVIRTHEESGAAVCTVNCDDYTLVSMTINGTPYELTSNTQQVDFERGDHFVFSHAEEGKKLAELKLNGVTQQSDYVESYDFYTIANNDVIDIRAISREYDMTFSFNNDRARSYIKSVEVDYEEVPDYSNGIKVIENAYVTINVDSQLKGVDIEVNGESLYINPFFSDGSFSVTGDTEVVVTAEDVVEPEKVTANINVDNAANIVLYYEKAGFLPFIKDKVPFELSDGENEVEIPEDVTTIYAEPAENCYLTSITLNGNDVEFDDYNERYELAVESDMNIVITSKQLQASGMFTLVCEDPSKVNLYLDGNLYTLSTDAEQTVNFIPETLKTVKIESADNFMPVREVLHNGATVEKTEGGWYEGPHHAISGVQHNDRIEVLLPTMYNVTINYGEGANENYIESVSYNDMEIDNFKEGFKAPEDVTLTLNLDSSITGQRILVNGEEKEPSSYGSLWFDITGNTVITVESNDTSIESLFADKNSTVDVFSIDGLRVKKNATLEEVKDMEAGFYIINGQKVLIGK